MVNGAKMNKVEVVKWLNDNGYTTCNGFGLCSTLLNNFDADEHGNIYSVYVLDTFNESFARGANMFRNMTCQVNQYLTLERVN